MYNTPIFLGKDINASKAYIEVTNKTGSAQPFSIADITCIV